MKVALVISPDFLEVMYKESQKYSFTFAGYGSFKTACRGLLHINAGDLLGIAYVSETFPEAGTAEYQRFIDFVGLCDQLKCSKKMVILTMDNANSLENALRGVKNLRVFTKLGETVITDSLINQSIYGSLLLDNYSTHKLRVNTETREDVEYLPERFTPALNEVFLKCFEPIKMKDDIQTTVEYDEVYQYFQDIENQLLMSIRRQQIINAFGEPDRHLELIIEQQLKSVENDTVLWSLCNAARGYNDRLQ